MEDGRRRATYVDLDGEIKRVSGPTRALGESRRDESVTALGRRRSPARSRFSITTTVREASDWWLESVARHQVRESSPATYRKSVAYPVDELGHMRVLDVGPEVDPAGPLQARLDRGDERRIVGGDHR